MLSLIQGDIYQQQVESIILPSDIALLRAPSLKQLHQNVNQQCNQFITSQKYFGQIQQTCVITIPITNGQFKYILYCLAPKYDINNKELQLSILLDILFVNIFDEISTYKIKSILIPILGSDNQDFSINEFWSSFQTTYQNQQQKLKDVKFIFVSQTQQEYQSVKNLFQITNLNVDSIYQQIPNEQKTTLTQKYNQFLQQSKNNKINPNHSDISENEIAQFRREYDANLSQKQNINYFSLFIQMDNFILSQKDLMQFMLEVCYDLQKLHQKLIQDTLVLEQSNQAYKYKLYYKQSKNVEELKPFFSPEMLENQVISETHDSYSLGILFKKVLQINYNTEQQDCKSIQNMIVVQQIDQFLNKLVSQPTERPQIDDIVSFLLSFQLNESFIEKWTQIQKSINQFYRKRGILQKIQEFKKLKLMKISIKNNQDLNSQYDFITCSNGNNTTENQLQNLSQQSNNSPDYNQSLYTKLNQIQFQQDCEYAQKEQNFKFCQIDCLIIPVDKQQFNQSLPTYIKLDKVLDTNLAQKDKEYYLHSVRTYVPTFGCNNVLLVFCPNQDKQIQLTNCLKDILLYTLKCLKFNCFCLCLEEICKRFITNQNDISGLFDEICKQNPDPVIWNEIQFKSQKWVVVKKNPIRFKLIEQSFTIHNQDITQIKGVDAIVNVIGPTLSKQSGICEAIFGAAGENLLTQEINQVFQILGKQQINISEVVVTKSYNLSKENGPKYIFHVVGPKYYPQNSQDSAEQLRKCISNILEKCEEYNISSIAIPPISARNQDYPKYKQAQIFKSAFLQSQHQNPKSILIVDVIDNIIEIFKIIFKSEKLRETIHSRIDFTPPTDCLVCPIDINNYNSQALKRIIELAGPSFKNELEYKIQNHQRENDGKQCQSYLIQGHKMKFNQIYHILLISKPQNVDQTLTLLKQVFQQILVETFLKKKFTSITILFYSILQQFLSNKEDLKRHGGIESINLFKRVIEDYQQQYKEECGKITILSNDAQFCKVCEQSFF